MSSQIEQLQNHYYQSLGLTAPDTNYHFYNNNYTRKLNDVERGETFLQEIFYSTTLSYLRKNKEFFIKNKNDPHFQGLMMLCVPQIIISTQNQEKLEFLLECGYNPNVLINKKAMYLNHENYKYPNGLVYSIEGLTPLHYFTSKPQLLILLKYGADPQKTSTMFNYLHDFIAQTGITKIKNLQELQQYIDFEFNYAKDHKEDTYFMETLGRHHYIYDTKNAIIYQSHIKTINHWLSLANEPKLNAYRLALMCEDKQKHLLLRNYENKNDLAQEEEKEALDILKIYQKNQSQAFKLLTSAIKKDNNYIINHVEDFLPLFQNKHKDIFNTVLRQGSMKLIKKLVENQYITDHPNANYLITCYTYHKTDAFKLLFENNFKNELDSIVNHVSKRLESPYFKTDKLNQVSAGIVYYLSQNGYHFEHQKVIEKMIAYEQERLKNIASNEDNIDKPKKKMKI